MNVKKYLKLSLKCLSEAKEMLKRGDYHNASEKLWGTAAHIVKAVAEKRGWKHSNHTELFKVVDRIVGETGDKDLRILFRTASALHQNFYENWMTQEFVKDSTQDIENFIKKMKGYGKLKDVRE